MIMKYAAFLVIPMIVTEGKVMKFGKVYAPNGSGPRRHGNVTRSSSSEASDQNLRFSKWAGKEVPTGVDAASAASSSNNTDTITSVQAIYYIGPVEIGTQTFQVIYDTGSNMLWVPSSSCGSDCATRTAYTGTSTSANQNFQLTYGSGTVSGEMVYAPVTFADATLSSFKLGLANSVGFSGFSSGEFDGILGLAWPALNSDLNVPSIVPTMYAANLIPDNLFTIYLNADGSNGELTLGEIDSTKYQGSIQWMPLVLEEWWTINLISVYLGATNNNTISTTSGNELTIIDSGTSLIVGPDDQVQALMTAIQNLGTTVYYDSSSTTYSISCSAVSSLPDINFVLAGKDGQSYHFTMPGATYVVATLSSNPSICPLGIQGSGSITSLASTSINWILGDPFLRTFYTIYDYGESRVGVAAAYPSAGSTVPGQQFKSSSTMWSSVFVLSVVLSVVLV